MSARKADVVVIGAGAMGSATAWWLARRGVDVALLEQFEPGHTRGSSHGGTRIFRFAYDDPTYVRMAQAALPLWRELEDDAGETLLDITGAVDHGNPTSVDARRRRARRRVRCAARAASTSEAAPERWPAMRFDGRVLFHPDGGRCLADATVRPCSARAAAHGAECGSSAEADCCALSDDTVEVDAAGETWAAPVAVVTAGAWVTQGARRTRRRRSRSPRSRCSTSTPVVEQDVAELHPPPRPVDLRAAHARRRREGRRAPRGSGHRSGCARAAATTSTTARWSRYVEEWMPGLDPTPRHTAECLYTTTPDESFVIERVGPVVIGSPCSGHGFKFTPLDRPHPRRPRRPPLNVLASPIWRMTTWLTPERDGGGSAAELEHGAGRVGDRGQAAVRRVLGGHDDGYRRARRSRRWRRRRPSTPK